MKKERSFFYYLIWMGLIVPVCMVSILCGYLIISYNVNIENIFSERKRAYIKQQKNIVKREVNRIIESIEYEKNKLKTSIKNKLKARVYEAHNIATNLYKINKSNMSLKEIERIIVETLSSIKFEHGIGYYFMVKLNGQILLFSNRKFEGENIFKIKDKNKKSIIKNMINLIKTHGEGFYEYYWTKPFSKGNRYKKISFIKFFRPLNCFIGTGFYIGDMENRLKKIILNRIGSIRFGTDGYIFVLTYNGIMLSHINKKLIGQNVWNVKDSNGIKIVQQFKKLISKPQGGFLEYTWPKPSTHIPAPKISFIRAYKPWQWMIGSGIYVDDVEKQIAHFKSYFNSLTFKNIIVISSLLSITLLIFYIIQKIFVTKIMQDIKNLSCFFKEASTKDISIEKNKLNFTEFKQLATYVNLMLEKKQEIQEKLKKEKELSEFNEQKYKTLIHDVMDNSRVGLFILNKELKVVWINKALEKMFGLKREEVIDKEIKKLVKEKMSPFFQDPETFEKRLFAAYEDNKYIENFICHMPSKGKEGEKWFEHWSCPIKSGLYRGGRVEHYTDITNIVKTTQALEDSENKLKSLFKAMTDLVFEIDEKGNYVYIAPSAEHLLVKPRKKLIGKSIFDGILPKELANQRLEAIRRSLSEKKLITIEYVLKIKGKERWFEARITPKSKNTVLFISRDITDKKLTELALREKEEDLRITLNSIAEGVITTDLKGKITRINPTGEKLLGLRGKDIIGQYFKDVASFFDYETKKEIECPINTVINTKSSISYQKKIELKSNTGKTCPVDLTASLIKDPSKNIRGVVVVINDITEKVQKEKDELKIEKLKSIGLLAGGIAHDFNNMLTGIFGNIELAKLKCPENSEAIQKLDTAIAVLDKAKALTTQLLTFAKGGDPVLEPIDLTELIKQTVYFNLTGSNIKPKFKIQDKPWHVKVDKSQISQVISNIVINAKEAMPNGGNLLIEVKNITKDISEKYNGYLMIRIKDQGIGIPPNYLDKIFDPYFTTKQTGSGLGLSIAYSIIKKHHGYIIVDSTPGLGTEFKIFLPALEDSSIITQQGDDMETEKNNTLEGRVLIMEDDPVISEIAETFLREIGLEVEICTNGEQTIEKYANAIKNKKRFDLIIMDLTIPGGMGGKETVKEILKLDKYAKVIVTSGYSNDPIMANFKDYGFIGKLTKPFNLEELKDEILKAMSSTQ